MLGIAVNAHDANLLSIADLAALRQLPAVHVGIPGTASAVEGMR